MSLVAKLLSLDIFVGMTSRRTSPMTFNYATQTYIRVELEKDVDCFFVIGRLLPLMYTAGLRTLRRKRLANLSSLRQVKLQYSEDDITRYTSWVRH